MLCGSGHKLLKEKIEKRVENSYKISSFLLENSNLLRFTKVNYRLLKDLPSKALLNLFKVKLLRIVQY